jgi:hypothetical protein
MKRLLTFLLLIPLVYPVSIIAEENMCRWELYFSPRGGCTDAIIRELNKVKSAILAQAFSFTSAPITKALLNAHKRRVKVEVIQDKSLRTQNYSPATFLHNFGIPVRSTHCYGEEQWQKRRNFL